MTTSTSRIKSALGKLIADPNLANARNLEAILRESQTAQQVLGRANQKSSIEAAAESDRGFTERLTNAFDASLTAARISAGVLSTKELTPRVCIEQFLCSNKEVAEWKPVLEMEKFLPPSVHVWLEEQDQKNRFRKYNPNDGLATVLVQDSGIGLSREEMPATILALNSEAKLRAFEAIGQFGHGGSSALSFCESCLILTQQRVTGDKSKFSWTLIVSEQEKEQSKQQLVRKWFCDEEGLPFFEDLRDFPMLVDSFPGTAIWHFGFNRGGWINRISGPGQANPWGRMGRLLFSYPLPFELNGAIARTDSPNGKRTIEGAFFRLLKLHKQKKDIDYFSGQISEALIVEGQDYGSFDIYMFVLADRNQVANYVDPKHPIILTLNGQNHGELTRTLFGDANLAELASSCIIEVRLDGLDDEALNEIISNSREMPKNSIFTRKLKDALKNVIASDEMLRFLENQRQMAKARKTSSDLSAKISRFLAAMISDAVAEPSMSGRGTAPGAQNEGERDGEGRQSRPEIPPMDPPQILEFLGEQLNIPEGTTVRLKFRSDARPPKYCFQGDNPRCFASIEPNSSLVRELKITGLHEISPNGYGHVTIYCSEDRSAPIIEPTEAGQITLMLQSTSGKVLEDSLPIVIKPQPKEQQRKRRADVRTNIVFVAPDEAELEDVKALIIEENILPFSEASLLSRYADALEIDAQHTTYWGDKTELDGESILNVEVNAANPELRKLLQSCNSAEERVQVKERYVCDIVLDCYQHCFRLEELPNQISELVLTEPSEAVRAAEIHLNHQKAIRIAYIEKQTAKQATAARVS